VTNRKVIIALIGLPSSGKTLLGKYLKNLGYCFRTEVAGTLISQGFTAGEKADQDFDKKVMRMEFSRDNLFCLSNSIVQVVETWHPGNMAYAMARSSPIVRQYKDQFRLLLQRLEARCLVLDLDPQISYLRSYALQKPTCNSVNFLVKVQKYMSMLMEEFGLTSITIDATGCSKDMINRAVESVQSWVMPK